MIAGAQYPWFYWIAPILFLGFVAVAIGLSSGYIRKVLIPRYRGKRVE